MDNTLTEKQLDILGILKNSWYNIDNAIYQVAATALNKLTEEEVTSIWLVVGNKDNE